MIEDSFRIELASWERDEAELRAVREPVFIVEQQVPVDEEWDELDARSVHVLARDGAGNPIGTGRLTPDRKIGRMAVRREWRGRGVGDAMLRTLLEQARALHYPEIVLHAQVDAIPFYERAGFAAEGAEFVEAGIRHRTMRLALQPTSPLRRASDRAAAAPRARHVDTDTLASAQLLVDELAQDARHKLWIYTRDLDRLLYDREPFLELVRRVALSGRGTEVRILVHDPVDAVRDGHRLLHLAARLPSFVLLRTPVSEEDRQYASAFLLNDAGGFLFRPIGSRYEGEGNPHSPGRHGALLAYFEQVWERSEPHPDLRRISL
jgi:predicted GNAT family N-acyltransferase